MSYSSITRRAPDADARSQATREELQRIVTSPVFEGAERLVRFLTFVVEETLAGKGGLLKESIIGVEVFGRSPGYDPKIDPIVRVQARRLRAKLDSWYENGGQSSTLRIALPKGGYAPEFGPPAPESTNPMPVPKKGRRVWMLAPLAVALLLGAGAAILTMPKSKPAGTGSRLFTAFPGYQTSPTFSPDGLTLAFAWGGPDGDNVDIYVQPLDADEPRRLTTSPARERNPVWLPDGKHIGFLRDDGPDRLALVVVPILGAGERRVAEISGNPGRPQISRGRTMARRSTRANRRRLANRCKSWRSVSNPARGACCFRRRSTVRPRALRETMKLAFRQTENGWPSGGVRPAWWATYL